MAALESATHPKVLANTAKHIAFTRCGELNFCDMVDAQIPLVESQLSEGDAYLSVAGTPRRLPAKHVKIPCMNKSSALADWTPEQIALGKKWVETWKLAA